MMDEVHSQYLAGTNVQFAWDSTSLGDFKTCPQYYYLGRIQGWQPKAESVHLRFGQLYQEALVDYDLSIAEGINHDDAVHDVVTALLMKSHGWWSDDELAEMGGPKSSIRNKTRFNLIRSAVWHMDEYRNDHMQTYILASGEGKPRPAVELSFRFELNWAPQSNVSQPYILCGHLDKVVKFADELYGLDNKTTGTNLGAHYMDSWDPENQMTLYTLATQVLMDAPVRGMIIDAAQVLKDETKFSRGMTTRTKDNLTEWVDELRFWFALQEQFAISNKWPHNDKACNMYGGCRFREVCTKSPSVRDRFLEAGFVQLPEEERWNPLKSRSPTLSTPVSLASQRNSEQSVEEKSATTSS
jgi:PD-(D/E)XK nuclease superfamily